MRASRIFGALLFCAALALPQPAPTASFEAADVRVRPPGAAAGGAFLPNGRLEYRATTLLHLISAAYSTPPERIDGGPSWLDTDRFDVTGKASSAVGPPVLRVMLQSLLAERFGLAVEHREKPLPAYVLTVARRGLLKESGASGAPECTAGSEENVRTLTCRHMTIASLAERLPRIAPGYFNLPVADRTGLTGEYDFKLRYLPRGQLPPGADGAALSLFNAIEKQTGIKVEQQNAPMPVIAVVRVNRTPAANPPGTAEKLGPTPTEFDVVDIRPSRPGEKEDANFQNGRIDAHAIALRDLITFAYNVEDDWVRGEKRIETERFNVVAKTAPTESEDTLRVMVQSLLADRFRLKVHREEQPVTVYALTVAKPRLKDADPSTRATCKSGAADGRRTLTCQNTTMAQLAEKLRDISTGYLDHPVVDLTGLAGAYDFTLAFTPRNQMLRRSGEDNAPVGFTLFEAIERQLGLKLTAQKHPMSVVVIDHIERKPAEN